MGKLTALKIAKLRTPGMYGDGAGLWLNVAPAGTRSWVLRYMISGRARGMGLGSASTIGLADARALAQEARRQILLGNDPIEVRRAAKSAKLIAAARGATFKEVATLYIESHSTGWKNPKHRWQWDNTMERLVYPIIGALPASEIDVELVLKVLEPIWRSTPETSSRIRGRIERILDYAKARGHRAGENPARWRGNLDHLLPAQPKSKRVVHLAALPYAEVPGLMHELRAKNSTSALALQFAILTAARTSEVIGATWDELDFAEKIWSIPGARMKMGKPHRVPLSAYALDILRSMPREGAFLFPGGRAGKPLSNVAMLKTLKALRPYTVHGTARSSFRDFVAERTAFPREIAAAALAHIGEDEVERAYLRTDFFQKRRRLMDAWGKFCLSDSKNGKVIPIRQSKLVNARRDP